MGAASVPPRARVRNSAGGYPTCNGRGRQSVTTAPPTTIAMIAIAIHNRTFDAAPLAWRSRNSPHREQCVTNVPKTQ
jgi:hypothetical protein